MAIDRFFTGFEGGEATFLALSDSNCVFLDDGKARTGQFCLYCNVPSPAAVTARAHAINPIAGIGITNRSATGWSRIFFKMTELPSGDGVIVFGYGSTSGAIQGTLRLNHIGQFAAANSGSVGPFSSSVLVTNTWYKAELQQIITDSAGAATITTHVFLYNENGTSIDNLSKSDAIATGSNFANPLVGHADTVSSSYMIRFDDWISIIEDSGPATLPAADRITRMDATGIRENTMGLPSGTWQGDYRAVTEIPFQPEDEMTCFGEESKLTFYHKTSAQLQVSGVQAIKIVFQYKQTAPGNQWLMVNTVPVEVLISDTYTAAPYNYMLWQPMSNVDFDDFTFGAKNEALTTYLGQMYCEVLHSGGNYWPSEFAGTGTWKHKIINYAGSGTFREVLGFGFKPQVVLIKKADGVSGSGVFRLGMMGGTRSKSNANITQTGRGILNILSDGFDLSPSSEVNEAGHNYVALAIQDGGYGTNCFFLTTGAYIGNSRADRDILIDATGTPNFVWVSGEQSVFRGNDTTGDDSTPLDLSASVGNLIRTLSSGKFTIEPDTKVNSTSELFYYFAIINQGYLWTGVYFGNQVGAGPSMAVAPLGFESALVIAKRIAAVDAQWRHRIFSGQVSGLWGTTGQNTTGIIDLPSGNNGFTLGSSLSNAGESTRYLAFGDNLAIPVGGILTVDAGPDQTALFGTTVSLLGSGTEHSYPCNTMTFAWSQVSGPGTAIFTTPNAPTTGVTFDQAGVYTLRLTANNGLASAFDDVQVTITCPAVTVGAGSDQTIIGTSMIMAGAVTGTTNIAWNEQSGPPGVIFSNAYILNPTVTFPSPGIYTLRLGASNQCMYVFDDTVITVLADCIEPTAAPTFNC